MLSVGPVVKTHLDALGDDQLTSGTPDDQPGGSPIQVYTCTYIHTHTNIGGGRSWPSRGPPHYDRKPIILRIISQNKTYIEFM